MRRAAVLALLPAAAAYLPTYARGGEGWAEMERRLGPFGSGAGAQQGTWDCPIDRADPSVGTYPQRFFYDDRYYEEGGPVFFQLGGEGPVESAPGGFIAELASTRRALLVQAEHRFYGESIPFDSIDTPALRYLTVDHALADYAAFTEWFSARMELPKGTKWFAFGGSYPGALSAWYRIAYPDATVGSLSSSGVVNAVLNFTAFDSHVAGRLGAACADAVQSATAAFEAAVLGGAPEEAAAAKALLNAREDMWAPDFFYMLADGIAMMDQYGAKEKLCRNMTAIDYETASAQQVRENTAALIRAHWGDGFGAACFYDTHCLRDPARYGAVKGATDRSWRAQKCSQDGLAYLQTFPTETAPLRSRVVDWAYVTEQCAAIFGEDFVGEKGYPDVDRINDRFGGAQPKATNVFYANHADDPWLEASVRGDLGPLQPRGDSDCDGCGHCADLHASSPKDDPSLQKVREDFAAYLDLWLAEEPA